MRYGKSLIQLDQGNSLPPNISYVPITKSYCKQRIPYGSVLILRFVHCEQLKLKATVKTAGDILQNAEFHCEPYQVSHMISIAAMKLPLVQQNLTEDDVTNNKPCSGGFETIHGIPCW
jgi:hypothetical protein